MNADSVKTRLKKSAKENKRLFQDELVVYCLEHTIYRISQSFRDSAVLTKGGLNHEKTTQQVLDWVHVGN